MKHTANRRRGVSTRAFVALLALVLVIGCVAGGTVAWLIDTSATVTNTFTYGDINITLAENAGGENKQFKIIPGVDITKDPKVTVRADSEDCWLFVKVTEENWPTFTETNAETGETTKKVSYKIADGWNELTGVSGVYYREVKKTDTVKEFSVLLNDKVTVSENLTKAEVNSVSTQPKLTFTAYAVQKDGIADAATAWDKVPKT